MHDRQKRREPELLFTAFNIRTSKRTSNVHRLSIRSFLDWTWTHHFQFGPFLTIRSIWLSYSFIFRQRIVLLQGKQTALRIRVMSINPKNREGVLEISFVFSWAARYLKTEYLTFFHQHKKPLRSYDVICIKTQLKKHTNNTSTFYPLISNRRWTERQAKASNPCSRRTDRP